MAMRASLDDIVHGGPAVVVPHRITSVFSVAELSPVVLGLIGELDLAAAPDLSAVMRSMAGRPGEFLFANLSRLEFCGCAGLTALLEEHWRRLGVSSRLVLIAPSPGLNRTLAITGLDLVFTIRPV